MNPAASDDLQLCSLFALGQGMDPIGYAGSLDAFLTVEVPLPWPRDLFASREKLPDVAVDAVERVLEEKPYRLRSTAVAPDPIYSTPGNRRVVWHRRPAGPFADFRRQEYLVPQEHLGGLVAALLDGAGDAGEYAGYLVEPAGRDLLACTHGTRDASCGRFGVPLYERLRVLAADGRPEATAGGVRVWRTSHLSGHIFAPTLLELPSGRLWAHLGPDHASSVVTRSGDVEELRHHYRGWSGLDNPFLQALERELFMRFGWCWLDVPKAGVVEETDDAAAPQWALVRIDSHGERAASYRARVEISHSLPIRPRSDSPKQKPYAQYQVGRIAEAAAASALDRDAAEIQN